MPRSSITGSSRSTARSPPTSPSSTARGSPSTRPSDEMDERDAGLIRFLMRERHGSPFEHGYFRFLVKAPLFVVREHHRHRAGHSYNEWSGRYSKMEPEFYVPENVRTQVGKPGAYTFEPVDDETRETARRRDRGERDTRVRGVRADARAGRREGGRPRRAARSRRTRSTTGAATRAASCTSARCATTRPPSSRSGSTRRPPSRSSSADADHARGVRRERPHRARSYVVSRPPARACPVRVR